MKPFFSVDTETTGLDRDQDQILEIAIVYEDPSNLLPLEELPKFHCIIKRDQYVGTSPYALSLNKRIFDILSLHEGGKQTPIPVLTLEKAIMEFSSFVYKHSSDKSDRTIPARFTGKNFSSFDLQFMKREGFNKLLEINHRFLEIGSWFFDAKTMDWVPSTLECYKLAGVPTDVKHDALGDSLDIVKIIRTRY